MYDTPQVGPHAVLPGSKLVDERARTAARGRALVRAALNGPRTGPPPVIARA